MSTAQIVNFFEQQKKGFKTKTFDFGEMGQILFYEFTAGQTAEALDVRTKEAHKIYESGIILIAIVLKNARDPETEALIYNKSIEEMIQYVKELPKNLIFGKESKISDICLEVFNFLAGVQEDKKDDDFVEDEKKS